MKSPLTLEQFRPLFNQEFEAFLSHQADQAEALDPTYGHLLEHLRTFLARGGKRLRPYLLYLSYSGHGGQADELDIVRVSISQELYHQAWLIHDDIIDRDQVRYGGPNLAGRYSRDLEAAGVKDAAHLATSAALLAGDTCLILAHQPILDSPFPPEAQLQALRHLSDQSFRVIGGELIDTLMPSEPDIAITSERLVQLCQLKTSSYSFVAPLQVGSVLAGATTSQTEALTAVGLPLGVAFQLADDLLSVFGNETAIGKSVLSDLREGKRTILLQHALDQAEPEDRQILVSLVGNPKASYHHLAQMRQIMTKTGAQAYAENLAKHYVTQATTALESLGLTPEVVQILKQLANYVIRRHT